MDEPCFIDRCHFCNKQKWLIATMFGCLCRDCLTLHSGIVNEAKRELAEYMKKNKEVKK